MNFSIRIAVVEDVGDGEVVAEGADDENHGSQKDRGEGGDAGAAGGFADTFGTAAEDGGERTALG